MRKSPAQKPPLRRVALVLSAVSARRYYQIFQEEISEETELVYVPLRQPIVKTIEAVQREKPDSVLTENVFYLTAEFFDLKIPFVIINPIREYKNTIPISADDHAIGELAAEHFIQRGFSHYAFAGYKNLFGKQRFNGFITCLQKHGYSISEKVFIPKYKNYLDLDCANTDTIKLFLQKLVKPTALYAAHDPLARHLSDLCINEGIRIPEEVSILGTNNDPVWTDLKKPGISSIPLPYTSLARTAIQTAIRTANGEKFSTPPRKLPPPPIATRLSTDILAIEDTTVRRAIKWLKEHSKYPVNIDEMCQALNLSRRSTEIHFKKHLGRSPHAELNRLRMERAAELLLTTHLPIKEIVDETGFNSPQRFSEAFKLYFHKSPSIYRSSLRDL